MRQYILASLILVACSRDTTRAPTPSPAPAAAPPAAQTKRLDPGEDLSSLAMRLRYEAQHRPTSGPTTERVLDTLDAAGLRVDRRRQYLGMAMHARYCAGGTTSDGIAVSVCEYATDHDATAGKTYADHQYASLAGATRATRGGTLLTLVRPEDRPAELVDRALHAFTAL